MKKMKNSRLEMPDVQAMSISELRNQNGGGCHDDTQLHYLLYKLGKASEEDANAFEIQFNERYDEVCKNKKMNSNYV